MSSLFVKVLKIDNILPIEGADKIESVIVDGWNTIVEKGKYKVGDLVVFIPPDSILPDELIKKYDLSYLKNGERVKTVKLKGVISQGLILPYNSLPVDITHTLKAVHGSNVSDYMGIKKWEPAEPTYANTTNAGGKKKINVNFDKYTNIENVKNFRGIFTPEDKVIVTEKIHGANFRAGKLKIEYSKNAPLLEKIVGFLKKTFFSETHEFVYGSHNVQISSYRPKQNYYGEDVWGQMCKKYNLAKIIPNDYILYGEIFGKNIQDLTYGLEEVDLIIFDITKNGKYLNWVEVENFCKLHGLKVVPVLYRGMWYDDILSDYTDGSSLLCKKQIREGVVIKPEIEKNHPRLGRKILKSVSVTYLLRKNATEFK